MMHFGSLSRLFSAKLKDFAGLNGIGPAKYAQLQAILELARRLLAEDLQWSDTVFIRKSDELSPALFQPPDT